MFVDGARGMVSIRKRNHPEKEEDCLEFDMRGEKKKV